MKSTFTAMALLMVFLANAQPAFYTWETQHAKVLPGGDLEWAPHEFQPENGNSVRYIDYENGDDSNDGLSISSPWKHHPWDDAATGNAAGTSGIHTYVFKRGVVYRGSLSARESGEDGNPIRLTSDPDWGVGEAGIFGSVRVTGGWTPANSAIAPEIPDADLVWYQDIPGLTDTKTVCEITGNNINQVRLARIPNYYYTPEEPMKRWWSFTAKKKESNGTLTLTDTKNLTQTNAEVFTGGDVWATEDAIVMCALWKQAINHYDPVKHSIQVTDQNFGGVSCKYFIENTPYLLDTINEFYYDPVLERMYLRLDGDKDPNTKVLEIAHKGRLVDINNKSNIVISGLTFGFTTHNSTRSGNSHPTEGMPCIKIEGACSDIVIKNCKFQYVNGGIIANGSPTDINNTIQSLTISDNEMNHMADFSILVNGTNDFEFTRQGIYLKDINILRNKISHNGERHLCKNYSSIPAIQADITTGEVAGNILEYCWGGGINLKWGKDNNSGQTIPFIRGFVHHNKVSHSMIGVNDYAGIESWNGGPAFYYNNISFDASGFKYNWGRSLGYAFYLDGAFKNYVFNNIAFGRGWNLNSAAYMQVLGFYNMYVHNVAYNLDGLTFSGDGNLAPDGQNYYLANVSDSTQRQFNHTTRKSGIPFESYGKNVFSGNSFEGTFVTNQPGSRLKLDFNAFLDLFNSYVPDLGDVGFVTSKRVFEDPASGNFSPTENSELIDQGVKFFIPFPLSRVVGEWHFFKHNADSTLIKGENFYFTSEFTNRETYNNFPKNHLKAYGLTPGSFTNGNLEDWTEGALVFDGIQTYCELKNNAAAATICNNVDMTTNSFILECYFKTGEGHTNGSLISKYGPTGLGYCLDVNETGNIRFSVIDNQNVAFSRPGATKINEGNWHHVLIEVNRQSTEVNVFIDGVLANGSTTGILPAAGISLTNSDDLLIGKNRNGNFFSGTIDFLRIAKCTLGDAETTMDELYRWEFDGPFLYDFAGNAPVGKRDAGALEKGGKLCDLSVSEDPIKFGLAGGTKSFFIDAALGFEVTRKEGSFFTYSVQGNTVTVTSSSASSGKRSGELHIYGCHETRIIKIVQQQLTHTEMTAENSIKVIPNPISEKQLLTIIIPVTSKARCVRFMDIGGKIINEKMLNPGRNSLAINLPKGIYLLNIFGEEENFMTKIVVN